MVSLFLLFDAKVLIVLVTEFKLCTLTFKAVTENKNVKDMYRTGQKTGNYYKANRGIKSINLLSSVFVFMIAKLLLVSSLRPAMSRN